MGFPGHLGAHGRERRDGNCGRQQTSAFEPFNRRVRTCVHIHGREITGVASGAAELPVAVPTGYDPGAMSGIAGIISYDGAPAQLGYLRQIAASMRDRGPDGTYFWSEGPCALAYCQLRTTPEARFERQ